MNEILRGISQQTIQALLRQKLHVDIGKPIVTRTNENYTKD